MADNEETEYLRVRLLTSFHRGEDGKNYSENSVVDVPARWARTWERAKAAEILGPGKLPEKPKPRKVVEPPTKRKELTGFIVDDMLKQIPTRTVKVRCVEFCELPKVGSFHEGREYELPREDARVPLISGHFVLVGPGAASGPSESERIAELESELTEMKTQQAKTQRAVQNVDILLHPTGDDKLPLRKKRRR